MKIDCVLCGNEINLDHYIFENYAGPIKCFCCGGLMEIKTRGGVLEMTLPPAVADLSNNPGKIEHSLPG